MPSFDYIISGAGCAGLSLALRLIDSGKFNEKKILLADLSFEKTNDRTWCFWEKGNGFFESLVYKQWNKFWFYGDGLSKLQSIEPYHYKMIRGIDFYKYALQIIRQQPNVTIMESRIDSLHSDAKETWALINGEKFSARYIFNSIQFKKPELGVNDHYLLQHFKGWIVDSKNRVFNPEEAVLMDFRIPQNRGTAFVYTMPFSENRALIEYTLFTDTVLEEADYEEVLETYVENITGMGNYEITEKEFGVIPMTTHRFPEQDHHIYHIGMAGGQTRASTGYTFQFIQKRTRAIVDLLAENKEPATTSVSGRFRYYDRLFLDVLIRNQKNSPRLFARLFGSNHSQNIFDFLDAESSLSQDLQVISSLPKKPFLGAALRALLPV